MPPPLRPINHRRHLPPRQLMRHSRRPHQIPRTHLHPYRPTQPAAPRFASPAPAPPPPSAPRPKSHPCRHLRLYFASKQADYSSRKNLQRLLPQYSMARHPPRPHRQHRRHQDPSRLHPHCTPFGIINARSRPFTITFAKNTPTNPATSPSTANSIEKIVAIRARVAPSVFSTTTSLIRR